MFVFIEPPCQGLLAKQSRRSDECPSMDRLNLFGSPVTAKRRCRTALSHIKHVSGLLKAYV
jgi:hypothetical protein